MGYPAPFERFGEEFMAWSCSDCDPAVGEPDDPEDLAHGHDKPYVLLIPKGDPRPDHCPRCGSYLSLCEAGEGLQIDSATTPLGRWAAQRNG